VVDRVNEVADIPGEQVEAAPAGGKGASGSFILGLGKIGDSVKILLDVNRLLYQ
jgi:purine-binding chemotaxis protein CheW